jgi:hypothetical protein
MKISDMHWRQVEEYLRATTRCVLPFGSSSSTRSSRFASMPSWRTRGGGGRRSRSACRSSPECPSASRPISPPFRQRHLRVETLLAVARDLI